jgi:hypothetical protein
MTKGAANLLITDSPVLKRFEVLSWGLEAAQKVGGKSD